MGPPRKRLKKAGQQRKWKQGEKSEQIVQFWQIFGQVDFFLICLPQRKYPFLSYLSCCWSLYFLLSFVTLHYSNEKDCFKTKAHEVEIWETQKQSISAFQKLNISFRKWWNEDNASKKQLLIASGGASVHRTKNLFNNAGRNAYASNLLSFGMIRITALLCCVLGSCLASLMFWV